MHSWLHAASQQCGVFLYREFTNNQRKGHLQGCFFDFKEREDDTMPNPIRGPPTGKAYM